MPNFNLTDQSGLRTIVGHVGREPELKHTQSGKRIARFTMATNRKDGAGNVTTDWHTINAWDDQADADDAGYVALVKPHRGKQSEREYNGKTYTEVTAWFLGVGFRQPKAGSQSQPVSNSTAGASGASVSPPDQDIPF